MFRHKENGWKRAPARYRLGRIRMLHWKFEAETGVVCSLEWLRQNIPFDVVCPKPNDWSTYLCATCINPEMKLDALANFTKDPSLRWDEGKSYDSTDCLISHIKAVDDEQRTILYNEWQRIEVTRTGRMKEASQRKINVSRKVPVQEKLSQLKKKLVKELLLLKGHLIRVHSQFKAFKTAREEAEQKENIDTIQMDWSENQRLTQSGEEKGAYY